MNSEKNFEVINEESFTLETLVQYIKENFYGLILLVFAFVIIYFVDYTSRVNALIFSIPPPIIGLPMPQNVSQIKPPKGNKFKKIKKH